MNPAHLDALQDQEAREDLAGMGPSLAPPPFIPITPLQEIRL
jgi:hypothetical protein